MLSKFKKISEKSTILKVVLCSLFVFFSSCSKFEEEQKQTTIVPNINEAQANIGGENLYEKYVNIEDFKNSIMEDFETYQKHQKALQKLLSYKKFPKDVDACNFYNYCSVNDDENGLLEDSNNGNYAHTGYQILENGNLYGKTEIAVECFVKISEIVYEDGEGEIERYFDLLTPFEASKISYNLRKRGGFVKGKDDYIRLEVPLDKYCKETGIPKEDFQNLRVLTRYETESGNDIYDNDYQYQYYQMPYEDNYKDYQNQTNKIFSLKEMKKYIKKGSMIFVFDKRKEELHSNFFANWGHLMVVTDKWYGIQSKDIKSTYGNNGYKEIQKYNQLKDNEDFIDVPLLRKEMFDDNVSFKDYLKHFVFVEAVHNYSYPKASKNTPNDNKIYNYYNDGKVKYTSGNDKRFQSDLTNYTCVAVTNVDYGFCISHKSIKETMIRNVENCIGNDYKIPQSLEDKSLPHYCSGIALYGFINGNKTPSLRLLHKNHINDLSPFGKWYMPRTVCNSPFVYTRVWYNN